jgi:hypothetical protein
MGTWRNERFQLGGSLQLMSPGDPLDAGVAECAAEAAATAGAD